MSERKSSERTYHHGDLNRVLRLAAAELIAERGAAGFSLREVARRAGVSHAAPSHHFGDATGLLTAVAIDGLDHLHEAVVAALQGSDDPVERLVAIGRAYVEVAVSNPGHCAVIFRRDLVYPDDPEYAKRTQFAHGELRAAVAAVAESLNSTLDIDAASRLCWATMQGLVQLYPNMAAMEADGGVELASIGDLADEMARLVVDGLRRP